MKIITTLVTILIISNICYANKFDRKSFIIKTENTKTQNFEKSLVLLSKRVGDSNVAIKVKERNSGLIVMEGNMKCGALSQWMAPDMVLKFMLTVNSKNKKVRMLFENLIHNETWDYATVNTKEKREKVSKECLAPVVAEMKQALNKKDDEW